MASKWEPCLVRCFPVESISSSRRVPYPPEMCLTRLEPETWGLKRGMIGATDVLDHAACCQHSTFRNRGSQHGLESLSF